ncbi:retrovirus-related pol polyprotein from transposon TNT 1-94 [Tanacetum coccineum]
MGYSALTARDVGHYARNAGIPKRVKDYAYHKEKMMMCKQAEQGVPLQAEQADWLEDTDEEIDEQELEAHYSYMAKIQEVSPEETSSSSQPLEQVQNHDENDVFANVRRHSEQPESINDTYVLEKDDSNIIPDSSNICTNDNQVDQNAAECVDERAALANLIADLTLDTEENKTVLKQLKKANASLTQGERKKIGKTKQTELEKYTALNDLTSDYKILQTKLNETLGLLALKDIDIKEGLKTKTYEISVVNQKHDELVKKSLLTRSQFEGQLKEKTKYLKKAHSDKPRLYEIPYDTSDPANRFCPDGEETVTLEKESRSKLDKDTVKPYNYTYQNSLYETFKPPSKAYLDQLERAKEVRKTMWRKTLYNLIPIHCLTSGCTKHMTGNLKLLCNFVEKFLGTVRFGNDQFAPILGYGDLIQGNVTIKRVYYVEGLNHNLFSLIHLDLFLTIQDETPVRFLRDFLKMIQRNLQAQVITVRTDRGTEFLNKTLHAYFKEEGIEHQTSTPRTPEQNGVVERRNRTLVEAARTMLSASKLHYH